MFSYFLGDWVGVSQIFSGDIYSIDILEVKVLVIISFSSSVDIVNNRA